MPDTVIPVTYFNSRLHGRRPVNSHLSMLLFPFQLTPSRKATGDIQDGELPFDYFNSRLHGRRLWSLLSVESSVYFNSRLHGRRPAWKTEQKSCWTFQLTPSRKATTNRHLDTSARAFQLTPSRKATGGSCSRRRKLCNFNSRLHGRRLRLSAYEMFLASFQLTPSRKATANSNNFCC